MKVKTKIKKDSGVSIKIDSEVCGKLRVYCTEKGLKIGRFATRAIEKELAILNIQS